MLELSFAFSAIVGWVLGGVLAVLGILWAWSYPRESSHDYDS